MEFSNMADIFTQITDITKDIIDSRTTKVLKTESSRYKTFPPESGFNQIVIRPLSQLISLPMETKRYIFSDAYKDQKKSKSRYSGTENTRCRYRICHYQVW